MDHGRKKLLNQEATAGCERWVHLEFCLLLIQAVSQPATTSVLRKNSWNFVLLGQRLLKSPATTNLF
ncbi:serine/threonine-protein phosphatase 7-like [Pyrus ussuriensis x Pyrus communis]|uniref:Serine/threonine-protein phosphatase 7-like n=1 Tax=Pyrus ussuriensis x Pyrus communis TaxID=2448454 RepID=A0A5N5GC24_9ROSA|nr:serine/threonine-protein phosphatase 7-like [Pyrus ussuriensis x Pyrus communis]